MVYDRQWQFSVDQCDNEEDDELDYNEFMNLFPPYY